MSAVISIVWTLIAPDRNASWEQLRADLHEKIEVLDDAQVRQHFSPCICGYFFMPHSMALIRPLHEQTTNVTMSVNTPF